jgi:RNA polymerase sigma factor (sigma-70 family)
MTASSINKIWEEIGDPILNTIKSQILEHYVNDILYYYGAKIDYLVKRYARSLPPHVADSEIDDLSTIAKLEFLETIKAWSPLRSLDIWPLAHARMLGAMKDHIRYITKSDPSRLYDWITEAAFVYMTSEHRADFETEIENGVQLNQVMSILTPREKQVIIAHAKQDLTFKQIGQKLDISESQISRIYKKALEKIQKNLKDHNE